MVARITFTHLLNYYCWQANFLFYTIWLVAFITRCLRPHRHQGHVHEIEDDFSEHQSFSLGRLWQGRRELRQDDETTAAFRDGRGPDREVGQSDWGVMGSGYNVRGEGVRG